MATQILPEQETPLGLTGRVTGHIIPGRKAWGEVTVNIRGGSECYLAKGDNPKDEFFLGELVIVVDYQAPKSVYVEHKVPSTER